MLGGQVSGKPNAGGGNHGEITSLVKSFNGMPNMSPLYLDIIGQTGID
jgi:hypothetical protein